jgi:RNA polymerase sigma-70 factor (ECF subfamily)
MVDPEEKALLEALRAGDEAAYEKLVREHTGRMLSVARRFLREEDDAKDAVQDAFVSAFRAIGNFEGDSRISTWLHRIVVNAALMKLRTRRRKPEESIDDLLPRWKENGHPEQTPAPWSAEKLLQRDQLRGLVQSGIDELPDTYREVLLLRDIEELDTSETAKLLGISSNAVKTRLHRARQALRELLDPALREDA